MGAWGLGPFDNDDAADWANELDDAAPEDRAGLTRAALAEAADEADYLDLEVANTAVAAAAVVALTRPDGMLVEDAHAPDFVKAGEPDAAAFDALVPLALRALDRVVADESEWRDVWEEAGSFDDVLAELGPYREALGG
ncbi:MAG TPA: DUF4259 domain-containing protein [Pseudonocardiaceae bacterium]